MPNDKTAGAPGDKQNQDGMFRWERYQVGAYLFTPSGNVVAQVQFRSYSGPSGSNYECWIWVDKKPNLAGICMSMEIAMQSAEFWWRAAAKTAKEMGLCEPTADPAPCFAVKDAAGHDHVYVTPEKTCRFRIASDGSLRDAVDMDGNPVEIRKVE